MLNLKSLWFLMKIGSYILYQPAVHFPGFPESSYLLICLINHFRKESFMVLTVIELPLVNLMKMRDLMLFLAFPLTTTFFVTDIMN